MPKREIKILVVDDSETIRLAVRELLEVLGYENVLEGVDGVAGLEVCQREEVDLIISDWNMPRMDGLGLLKAIRSDPAFKNLPVLIMSANTDEQDILETFRVGANGYLKKPFTLDQFEDQIEAVLPTS